MMTSPNAATQSSDRTTKLANKLTRQQQLHKMLMVERHSRFVMLVKVENKDTQSVIKALIKQARKLPKDLYRSLTWDRGSEMPGTASSQWPQRSTSTSAILNHHGKEGVTKIPIDFFVNTSQKALIYRALAKQS